MFLSKFKSKLRDRLLKRWDLDFHCSYGRSAFSQEGEDILLWRMMDRDHSPATYIDVGCNHPFHMSNTAFLYLNGWSGVAIDPNPQFTEPFKVLRPQDKFINCGVSASSGSLVYHQFEESLYNTFDTDHARLVAKHHSKLVGESSVPVRRLDSILPELWPDGKAIRFLSIDCEGLDHEVVESHDFHAYPVEFICVEVGSVHMDSTTSDAAVRALTNRGFIPIAKLCKSAILVHGSVAESWGLA